MNPEDATPPPGFVANGEGGAKPTDDSVGPSLTESKSPHPQTLSVDRAELQTGRKVERVEVSEVRSNHTQSNSTFSTFSTGTQKLHTAIYPAGSWLERYMDYARKREESADSYLIGSILPVVAANLARRIWLPWGDGKVYCNLFSIAETGAANPVDGAGNSRRAR